MDPFIHPSLHDQYAETPLTLVDVGARWGVHSRWDNASAHLRVIGFEPDAEEHARLEASSAPGVKYLQAALAESPGEVTLNITRSPGSSSILPPNAQLLQRYPDAERFDVVRTASIVADSMDGQLTEAGVSDVDFIKIDTQGSELSILRGAPESLGTTLGLEIEVEFIPLYKEQPLFADVDAYLADKGFWLFDVRPYYWKRLDGQNLGGQRGQAVFADVLYLRTPESLSAHLETLDSPDLVRSKVLRALSVSLTYGYVDYALELFNANRSSFSAEQVSTIEGSLRANVGERWFHRIKGMGRIARGLGNLSDTLMPAYRGFGTSGRGLGNY